VIVFTYNLGDSFVINCSRFYTGEQLELHRDDWRLSSLHRSRCCGTNKRSSAENCLNSARRPDQNSPQAFYYQDNDCDSAMCLYSRPKLFV